MITSIPDSFYKHPVGNTKRCLTGYRLSIGADPNRYSYPDPSVPIIFPTNISAYTIILRLVLLLIHPLVHTLGHKKADLCYYGYEPKRNWAGHQPRQRR